MVIYTQRIAQNLAYVSSRQPILLTLVRREACSSFDCIDYPIDGLRSYIVTVPS